MDGYKKEFIEFMVRSGVLTFGDFVTKSGRRTPYFVNTGNYKTGAQISRLGDYYAECIHSNLPGQTDLLFGPAYKGIPLAVAAASSLYRLYGEDAGYCFNRKEAKDHGEGGILVGRRPEPGDNIVIVEDVITAGTSVRETLGILAAAGAKPSYLIVSVDRMERGAGERTPIAEIYDEFGIKTFPIVTVREIIDTLSGRAVDGKVVIDDTVRAAMENYLEQYCVK
jgi:orotate phosphoribosyltransferase